MDELRAKIANILIDDPVTGDAQVRRAYARADRILAIPAIAEALNKSTPTDVRENIMGEPCRFDPGTGKWLQLNNPKG